MYRDVFIGLGSNLHDPERQLASAVTQLVRLDGVRLNKVSSLYRSAPLGYTDQPAFLNAVAWIETRLAPQALLDALHAIEAAHGRIRSFRDAPRTLDLDIVLYGDLRQDDPALTLPHPRCHERAFVLLPLLELSPECAIPGRGAARDWLSACSGQAIEKLGAWHVAEACEGA